MLPKVLPSEKGLHHTSSSVQLLASKFIFTIRDTTLTITVSIHELNMSQRLQQKDSVQNQSLIDSEAGICTHLFPEQKMNRVKGKKSMALCVQQLSSVIYFFKQLHIISQLYSSVCYLVRNKDLLSFLFSEIGEAQVWNHFQIWCQVWFGLLDFFLEAVSG